METMIKEYKVYSYNELSEKSKENVREFFRMNDIDIETDKLEDDFKYQLQEKHTYFTDVKFAWSLGCCQGDGLSFSCNINLSRYLKAHKPKLKTSVHNALCNLIYNLQSNGNNKLYCFASKWAIDYEYENYNDFKYLRALLDDVVDEIKDLYYSLCKDFEKQGYEAYEYLESDDYAKKTCEANKYKFLENGEFFNN